MRELCEIGSFDKDKRQKYDSDMYDEKRHNGELIAAREDGYAEGEVKAQMEIATSPFGFLAMT